MENLRQKCIFDNTQGDAEDRTTYFTYIDAYAKYCHNETPVICSQILQDQLEIDSATI